MQTCKSFLLVLITGALLLLLPFTLLAQEDAELAAALEDYIADDEPGLVVHILSTETNVSAAAGLADLNARTPLEITDRFRIGSASKTFVATIVLQLVDEGAVSLDDPISAYLPAEITQQVANADSASVRQVLNMTSGIYSYTDSDAFDDATFDDPGYAWTAAEVIAFAYDEAPYFAPGEDYYYSNSNYILLQLLIESITGQSLADQLEARIFTPLGMDSCALEDPTRIGEGIVRGYGFGDGDQMEEVTFINDGVGLGDGGIVCAAADLARFLPALIEGELLSDEQLAEMLTYVDDGEGEGYGLGIGTRASDYGTLLGHDGATSGFQSDMLYLPEEGISIVVLTNNFDSEIVTDVAAAALEWEMED